MRYVVELDRNGRGLEMGTICAGSDKEAHEKARIWAKLLNPARHPALVSLEKANGTQEVFLDGAAEIPVPHLSFAVHTGAIR